MILDHGVIGPLWGVYEPNLILNDKDDEMIRNRSVFLQLNWYLDDKGPVL